MQISTNIKTFLTAGLTLFIFACNDSSKKDKDSKDKMGDTTVAEASLPPAENPPGIEETYDRKCYANEGLKYRTVIMLNYSSANELTGSVSSQELESNETEVAKFTGTIEGDKITVQFSGTPPVIGAATEWTEKPWTLKEVVGKSDYMENLRIVFNAKNYDTNKWEDTDYVFILFYCK